ncbi:MAG: beta-ketoacyl-ACP synthase II [Myxococcales bacterium]|nr:beta-ketoacyl-ACP synthase II [Myxococcales bacterium]
MTQHTDHRGRPRVVVTGMGLITPCGNNLEASWRAFLEGRSGIGPITRWDCTAFDTKIAGEVKDFDPRQLLGVKEARRNDAFIQYAIVAADQAVAHSQLVINETNAERVGVLMGAGLGGLQTIETNAEIVNTRGPKKINPFFIPMLIVNLAPGQISIRTGAKGPNWSPVSACATSAHAIGEAVELIRRGGADAVIAGGSEATITPLGIGGFNAMRALSTRNAEPTKASRPWDKDRDGFVMGEGAGAVVVERLEFALARGANILGEVAGYGATADAYHVTSPDGEGSRRAMREALDDASVQPVDVDYINAHGTSTAIGDTQELEAIKEVFGSQAEKLAISSTKSMHGHMLGAAGAVETIISIQSLIHGKIAPTINLDRPDEGCDLDLTPHKSKALDVHVAVSNSFGFGGTNVCLVLKRYGE